MPIRVAVLLFSFDGDRAVDVNVAVCFSLDCAATHYVFEVYARFCALCSVTWILRDVPLFCVCLMHYKFELICILSCHLLCFEIDLRR